jgi:hypothetical protein
VLDDMGGVYTVQDLVDRIRSGHMQSFMHGTSWVVTQVLEFPQRKVMEIFLAVGELADAPALHTRIMQHAEDHGCDLLRAYGRNGWRNMAKQYGWTEGTRVFMRACEPKGER